MFRMVVKKLGTQGYKRMMETFDKERFSKEKR